MWDFLFRPYRPDPLESMKEINRHQEAMADRGWPLPPQQRWESKIEYRSVKNARPTPKGDAMRPEDV